MSPHLRPCDVDYDTRWLGWGRTDDEVWSDAERFGILKRGGSFHAVPNQLRLFESAVRKVEESAGRVVSATFARLGRPANTEVADEKLTRELGETVYVLLAEDAPSLASSLKTEGEKRGVYCGLRSLCLALGAYVKDHCLQDDGLRGVLSKVPRSRPQMWRWGEKSVLEQVQSRHSPNASVRLDVN